MIKDYIEKIRNYKLKRNEVIALGIIVLMFMVLLVFLELRNDNQKEENLVVADVTLEEGFKTSEALKENTLKIDSYVNGDSSLHEEIIAVESQDKNPKKIKYNGTYYIINEEENYDIIDSENKCTVKEYKTNIYGFFTYDDLKDENIKVGRKDIIIPGNVETVKTMTFEVKLSAEKYLEIYNSKSYGQLEKLDSLEQSSTGEYTIIFYVDTQEKEIVAKETKLVKDNVELFKSEYVKYVDESKILDQVQCEQE